MNTFLKRLPFLLLGLFFHQITVAQVQCGTSYDKVPKLILNNNARVGASNIDRCLNKVLSLNVHIVRDSLGQDGVTLTDIQKGVDLLNQHFAPICLQFKICKTNYIDNYKYNKFIRSEEDSEWIAQYDVKNVLDVIYVKELLATPSAAAAAGISGSANNVPIIITKKSAKDETLTHEMGHTFSLLHPFETANGIELVKRTNCTTAGDGLCDTFAERVTAQGDFNNCVYVANYKDSNGDYITPTLGNIMSYQPCYKDAPYGFTTQQYNRMIAAYLSSWTGYY